MAQGPVLIMDRPITHPFVCMSCGVQEGRQYFVDLGLDISEAMFKPLWDGRIYLCNQCIDGMITDYNRVLDTYLEKSNEFGRGDSSDQVEPGGDSGIPEEPDSNVEPVSSDEPIVVTPLAATLDSTNPFGAILLER